MTTAMTEQEQRVIVLRELTNTQSSDGNWNFDPYQFGLANGLRLALAMVTGEKHELLDPPTKWLCEGPDDEVG